MITVHHLESSRSQRILWMLEELDLPYEIVAYKREPSMQAPAALKEIHPLGKSPVIVDGAVTVAESGAILEYLVQTYGKGRLQPEPGGEEWRRYTYFMHYAEGSLMPLLVMKLINSRIVPGTPSLLRPIARKIAQALQDGYQEPNLRLHLGYVENELARSPWFAGTELSIADIQMSFPLEAALARAASAAQYPRIAAFVKQLRARPAYQRAAAKAGPAAPLR